MPIPRKKVKIDLKEINPTPLTPEELQKQLHSVGLDCKYTSLKNLEKFINEVSAELPTGTVQSYAILEPAKKKENRLVGLVQDWENSAKGNWEIEDIGYSADLEYIQYNEHFEWLLQNRTSFTGIKNKEHFERQYESVDSIKNFFADVCTTASSAVIKGVNKSTLKAAMSNAIQPLNDTSAKDYDKPGSRVIFLVENYNPSTKEADMIGVLAIDWHLIIKDYQVKKEALKHNTVLDVNVRAVLYSDMAAFEGDLRAAKAHFGPNGAELFGGFPVKERIVTIYEQQPPADENTFRHSLPVETMSDHIDVMVMFSPDLQLVATIDNSNSNVSTTYAKSVTTGFTFSSTQSLGFKFGFSAGVVFAKASFEFTFTISFTEQYSKSTTETVNVSVPKGEKAFLYQGTLQSRILRYSPKDDSYTYLELGGFLSTIFDTLSLPIPNKPTKVLSQLSDKK
jgi:hypothetical protein